MAFIALTFALFYGVFYLLACLIKGGHGAAIFLLNLVWAGICFYAACTTGRLGIALCVWIFVAFFFNISVLVGIYEAETAEGRAEFKRRNEAQNRYDNNYRNYVKERKESKKGIIEFTEKN